MQQEVMGW